MKSLLATANPAKIKDFRLLLSDLPIELITPEELGITESPRETGTTFEENARLKAEWYMKKSGLPSLADDGGLEIDALGGMPGVYSRRWPLLKTGEDREVSDEELMAYTLNALRGTPKEKRGAQMHVVVALAMQDECIVGEGIIRGFIAEKPFGEWQRGFPFRALFFVPECKKYYSEFTEEDHKQYNQRVDALKSIKKFLQQL